MTSMSGGCRCGEIRYEVQGVGKFSFACHCTDCQQLSASAFSLGLAVDECDFTVTRGALRRWTKTGSSGKPSHAFVCPTCAVWTHTDAESAAGVLILRPTTLDVHGWYRPVAEIFTRSALPWSRLAVPLSFREEFEDTSQLAAVYDEAGIAEGAVA